MHACLVGGSWLDREESDCEVVVGGRSLVVTKLLRRKEVLFMLVAACPSLLSGSILVTLHL